MAEKVITIYDTSKFKIVGLIIVEEIELYYISTRMITYLEPSIKSNVISVLESFDQSHTNIPHLMERVRVGLKNYEETACMCLIEPFLLESENKNKSSRNKRMLEFMNLSHLERNTVYYGKKSN